MRKSRYTDEQMVKILRETDRSPVVDVAKKHGVNMLACMCAIDKATLPPLLDYWVPGIEVAGVHELLGNALIMRDGKERTTDLRGDPLPEKSKEEAAHA
jgi:hypothetical protein